MGLRSSVSDIAGAVNENAGRLLWYLFLHFLIVNTGRLLYSINMNFSFNYQKGLYDSILNSLDDSDIYYSVDKSPYDDDYSVRFILSNYPLVLTVHLPFVELVMQNSFLASVVLSPDGFDGMENIFEVVDRIQRLELDRRRR